MDKNNLKNMIISVVAFTPIIYLLLMFLIWKGTDTSFTNYRLDLIILIIGIVTSMTMTILLLVKSWSKEFDQKDFIKQLLYSAVFQLPTLVGFFLALYSLLKA